MHLTPHDYQTKSIKGKRHYLTPQGPLPSVTTITSATDPPYKKAILKRWREKEIREGRDPNAGASRGTRIHTLVEDHLQEKPLDVQEPEDRGFWLSIKPFLSQVQQVLLLESVVWVPKGYAGRLDCLGIVDGKVTLLDWKTSSKPKKQSYVDNYYLQAGAYHRALEMLYQKQGLQVEQAKIVIGLPDRECQVFELNRQELGHQTELFRQRWRQYQNASKGKPQNYYQKAP